MAIKTLDGVVVPKDQYQEGLLDVLQFLTVDLIGFLEKEGRYKGVVKSWMNNIFDLYDKMNKDVDLDDIEVYGRILYLLKRPIGKEYSFLRSKRLSSGDCIIVIMVRILNLIVTDQFRFQKEAKTIHKILVKLYDYIKNRNKETKLNQLVNFIKNNMEEGIVGKYETGRFSIADIESPHPKSKFYGNPIKLNEGNMKKIREEDLGG